MDYQNTPSFYNNEDFFNQYLGCTSYYTGLQNVVKKIIKLTNAHKVLELGSALGTTTLTVAKEYPNVVFCGSDIRADIVDQANKEAKKYKNVSFMQADMCEHVASSELSEFDLVFLLYSFHHILDPLDKKIEFLKNCYANMKKRQSYSMSIAYGNENEYDVSHFYELIIRFDVVDNKKNTWSR